MNVVYVYKPEAQRSPLSQPPLPISSQTPPPHPRDHEALANAPTQEEVACLKKKKEYIHTHSYTQVVVHISMYDGEEA